MSNKKYTVKEAAEVSGMSEAWWRKKIQHREVLFHRVGDRIFIPKETIDNMYEVVVPVVLKK